MITPDAWRAQPWKNGAGTTYELLREPAEPAPFDWRVSVADVVQPAPFSAFTGYRRWLYLLDGGPVTLAIAGRDTTLVAPGDGIAFSGDDPAAATVVARPSRDLNFIARAGSSAIVRHARVTGVVFAIEPCTVDAAPLERHACTRVRDAEVIGLAAVFSPG